MEYFLYGFEDAHQLMQQLQKLGQMQIRINEELESALRTQTVIEEKIYNSKRQN